MRRRTIVVLAWEVGLILLASVTRVPAQMPEQKRQTRTAQGSTTLYAVEDSAIVRRNGDRYHHRPLYCQHMPALVMAGDRPCLLFASEPYICGEFMVAMVRGDQGRWLHQFSEIGMYYRPGRIEWQLRDPLFPGLSITMQAVTLAETPGFAMRLEMKGTHAGDKLVWVFGGATQRSGQHTLNWQLDPCCNPDRMQHIFQPEDCRGNVVRVEGDHFLLQPPPYAPATGFAQHIVAGRSHVSSSMFVVDASAWTNPATLVPVGTTTKTPEKPLLCGVIELKDETPLIYWVVEDFVGDKPGDLCRLNDPAIAFEAGIKRVESVANQVTVETPVDWLNVAVPCSSIGMDAAYYPPVYVHGTMAWNIPFPGWRTTYGPTAYGWHDNVKTEYAYYIASQTTESNKRFTRADPNLGYGQQAQDSRFYGKGRIQKDNLFYNFQTQFFDQAIYAWRATADPELEKILRPALELQLEWARDCFDPDGDSVYESYINCWPTDSQWYNGGGTAEESAYAYTGHRAAADMARRAGDTEKIAFHQFMADKIKAGVLASLWVRKKGHMGSYREQLGLRRLHTDAWLYSIFLPIDAGMLTWQEAAQALHYTEWGLERQKMSFGGQRCWTSNWVPSKFSVREMFAGDNYHLALAYYQTGLPEDAWELLKGTTLEAMFNEAVPGAITVPKGGTDFNDCTSMFCRLIVEGLFGYVPDYPNEKVTVRPGFPRAWDHASIRTPDYSLAFKRGPGVDHYECSLRQPARLCLELPIYAGHVEEVTVNNKKTEWETVPGIGRTLVRLTLDPTIRAVVSIRWSDALATAASMQVQGNVGESIRLAVEHEPIIEYLDPQEALSKAKLEQGAIVAKLNVNPGHHLVLALVESGKARHWRQFKIHISDPVGEAAQAAHIVTTIPSDASWECINLTDRLNGDVRAIHKQQYLSPRPETCSVRIGSDGYSPWTFYYWKLKPPVIDLNNVRSMLTRMALDGKGGQGGQLLTPQGVPFLWPAGDRNIAFTSQWDNWPRFVTVPVNKKAAAAWFLICGSTNSMQTRIANGRVVLTYADGVEDVLELVPPENFWTLCPIGGTDYDYERDGFCLPRTPPPTVQLGNNCRAMVLNRRLRPDMTLKSVTLETLSQEVIIGLMGVTLMFAP